MAETYDYSKAKVRPRLIRERIYLGASLAFVFIVIGQKIASIAGWI